VEARQNLKKVTEEKAPKPTKEVLALARKIVTVIAGKSIDSVVDAFNLVMKARARRRDQAIQSAATAYDSPGIDINIVDDLSDELAEPAHMVQGKTTAPLDH